jgi:hypothetical protein
MASAFRANSDGRDQEVPPSDAEFHKNYRETGDFPGAAPGLSTKEIMTRLYKAVGPLVAPMI